MKHSRISNVNLDGAVCNEADKVYVINGNVNLPIENVKIWNVKVGLLNKGANFVANVRNLDVRNVSWDAVDTTGTRRVFPNFDPGR